MHRLAYEFGWQHLTDPTNLASRPVQEQLGHKLRSSLSYNLMVNHLTPVGDRPESGYACRWLSEVGGLHPHSQVLKFMKHRADIEIAAPILSWMSASLGLTAGDLCRGCWIVETAANPWKGAWYLVGGIEQKSYVNVCMIFRGDAPGW